VSAPVLILSARRSVDERVLGLDKGGDDYMTKPFAAAELLARVRARLRRTTPVQPEATRLRAANLELDLIRRGARRDGNEIELTQQEFALLEYLMRNAGRVVTRTMLLDHVWKVRTPTSTNIVDVHIHRNWSLAPAPGVINCGSGMEQGSDWCTVPFPKAQHHGRMDSLARNYNPVTYEWPLCSWD
jgi:DNA-binding response OmpR family regulator